MKSNDSGLMTSMGRAQCGERGKVNECWAFGRQAAKTFHKSQEDREERPHSDRLRQRIEDLELES